MSKKVLIVAVLTAVTMAGCSEPNIEYKGQIMPMSEAEERIADELEVDNPDMDLEVKIYEESDD